MASMTVSPDEIARFDALAARWWDPDGPMRPLHRMNPARVPGSRSGSAGRWCSALPQKGGEFRPPPLRILLPLVPPARGCWMLAAVPAWRPRRWPAWVTTCSGLDAAGEAIEAARAHAAGQGSAARLSHRSRRRPADGGARFPVITALEVIEHVPDPAGLPGHACRSAAAWRSAVLSTLNRTPQSFLAAKVGAEYVLRWLPVGTHDWRRFITPAELGGMLRDVGTARVGHHRPGRRPVDRALERPAAISR